MDGTTASERFANHLNALHASRRDFIESEVNERIRRAFRTKVRAAEQSYENRDLVFYKGKGKEKWLGPSKVVFQDGKVMFVRHGNVFVRVSPNSLACQQNKKGTEVNDSSGSSESTRRTGSWLLLQTHDKGNLG